MKRGGIMVRYWTYIRVSDDSEITFVVQLKNRSRFVLNDCYFTIYKELFKRHPDSDYFLIELVGQYDERMAEEKIKRCSIRSGGYTEKRLYCSRSDQYRM